MLEGKITRLQAAAIIHEALINEKKEADEEYWQQALRLKDIYDCRKCVRHVAQTYIKGIILPKSEDVFGTQDYLSEDEKLEILDRLWHEDKRVKPSYEKEKNFEYITYEQAVQLKQEKRCNFIDVRDEIEFEEKYKDIFFNNITFDEIKINPFVITPDLNEEIILKCKMGYLSTLVADILINHGYRNVKILLNNQ